jgi:hypothetical protein
MTRVSNLMITNNSDRGALGFPMKSNQALTRMRDAINSAWKIGDNFGGRYWIVQ